MGWRPSPLGWRPSLLYRLKAIALRLEAIPIRVETIALRFEAIALEFEVITLSPVANSNIVTATSRTSSIMGYSTLTLFSQVLLTLSRMST